MARLDRLVTGKEIAQIGAILGREFTYELLRTVSPVAEERLGHALAKLVEAEVLYQRGLPPQATYLFKHALIQDTAYHSLLKSKRQQLHQQIAQVLEEQFAETAETQPELVAHHYTEAGLAEQAIPYWKRAGEQATQRSANVEAIAHLTKGLDLLKSLPDTPERAQQELTLQITMGSLLIATNGNGAPEVEKAYAYALELCQRVGETPQLLPVLFGLRGFYGARAEYKTARALGEQSLTLAQSVQDPTLLLLAHTGLGIILFFHGEFVLAREHLELGIALYDPQQNNAHASRTAQDPGVSSFTYLAWTLWFLGYPDQARKKKPAALTLAQKLAHPHSLAWAFNLAAKVHLWRREGPAVQEQAEAMLRLANEHELPYWLTEGTMLRGWALAEQEQAEKGLAQMRQGFADWRAMGTKVAAPYILTWQIEGYQRMGQIEEGQKVLTEALTLAENTGENFYKADLYRLKGTLKIQSKIQRPRSQVEQEAEECFLIAIEIAQKQQAKSLELRATTSLARLWQHQGKQKDAHHLLFEIYGWFNEGFDTKDL